MNAPAAGRVSRWPVALAALMLLAALGTLLWLRAQLIEGERSVIAGTVKRFEVTNVLGRPESLSIIFEEVETLVKASETNPIQRLYVTKRLVDGREVTVVPHHIDLTDRDWRNGAEWVKMPVGRGPQGYLYMQLSSATINAVNAAITLFSIMLAAGFAVLLIRQRGKEQQLGRTLVELEGRKAQVIHLERLALAGQLSANVFHDIKKPVLNIKHEVADALDGHSTDTSEVLKTVHAQTELFLQMLRDLGMETFVNASAQAPEWCDLEEAVARSLRLVKYEQGGIGVSVEFRGERGFLIQGVPHKLVQLFSNLVLNAFQAMGEKGELTIRGTNDGRSITIEVEDTGPGVPEDKREEVFSPFVTTRAQAGGSGLGLYICRTIVNDLGGSIGLGRRSSGTGARFTVTFPSPPDPPDHSV